VPKATGVVWQVSLVNLAIQLFFENSNIWPLFFLKIPAVTVFQKKS
jgi:hypothetical protein